MTFWDRVKAMLRREQRELDEMVDDANRVMDRKEREMAMSPEEKLRLEQERADEADAAFDELRKKIERPGS